MLPPNFNPLACWLSFLIVGAGALLLLSAMSAGQCRREFRRSALFVIVISIATPALLWWIGRMS